MDKTDARLKDLEKQIKSNYTKAYKEMKEEVSKLWAKMQANPDMPMAQKMALMNKYDRLNTLSNQLANTVNNANTMAEKMMNNEMVNVYEINYNGDAERLGFSLVDHSAIKKILKEEENPFTKINALHDKTAITNKMKGELMTGLLKGESMQKIATRFKNVSEGYLKSAIRVARTETTRVQNSAKMDIGKHGEELGFVMMKRWEATTDHRVRDDHLAMNGVEVEQDQPFVLPDGSKMMFPADISLGADAGQVINCRCTVVEFIKRDENGNLVMKGGENEYINKQKTGAYFQSTGENKSYVKNSYWEGETDMESAKRFEETIDKLSKEYPIMKEWSVENPHFEQLSADNLRVGTYNNMKPFLNEIQQERMQDTISVLGQHWINPDTGEYVIGIHTELMGKADNNFGDFTKGLENRLLRRENDDIIPAEVLGMSPEAIAIHEWGHGISNYVDTAMIYGDESPAMDYWRWYKSLDKSDIARQISDYATENRWEFEAECFAEIVSGKPSPIAQKYWGYVERCKEFLKAKSVN